MILFPQIKGVVWSLTLGQTLLSLGVILLQSIAVGDGCSLNAISYSTSLGKLRYHMCAHTHGGYGE